MKNSLFAILLVSLAAEASAANDVTIKSVNDRRTNGSFSRLTIALEIPGVRSSDVSATRVLVSSATDDSGRSLVDTEAEEPRFQNSGPDYKREGQPVPPASVDVELKNPDRKATKLKDVRGQIEMLVPGRDANTVAEIPKFLSLSGKPVAHKALKANGVDMALVSPAQRDAEKKRLGDVKRKEAKESGLEGEDLDRYVGSYLESLLPLEDGELLLKISDPNKTIHDISYVDGSGEVKRASARSDEGFFVLSTWGDKPQADWKLRVTMKTAKNIVKQPFTLTNVALP
jgi:hypothetical protein